MVVINKITGRDISHLVLSKCEGLITTDEYELLAFLIK